MKTQIIPSAYLKISVWSICLLALIGGLPQVSLAQGCPGLALVNDFTRTGLSRDFNFSVDVTNSPVGTLLIEHEIELYDPAANLVNSCSFVTFSNGDGDCDMAIPRRCGVYEVHYITTPKEVIGGQLVPICQEVEIQTFCIDRILEGKLSIACRPCGGPSPLRAADVGLGFSVSSPIQQALQILVSSPQETNAQVSILDLSGREVLSQTINLQAGESAHKFSTQRLSSGAYIIRLKTDNEVLNRKFIVD